MATLLDRLLDTIVQPAVRLDRAGKILAWNPAAEARFGTLAKRQPIAPLLPESMRMRCTEGLLATDREVVVPCGRILRVNARERLLVFDAPQADAFDELPLAMLVWDTGGGELASANDLRLVAASREAEHIGPRLPMRQFLGRLRGEIGPITALDDAYMEVARTGERRVVPDLEDGRGDTFSANIFPVRGNRIAVTFESSTGIRRAELGYRTIFEHAHDAIIVIDPETEAILDANPAAVALYARGPLEGVTVRQLSRNYRPGLSERILAHRFLRFETTHVRGDGADLHLDANLTVIDHDGRPVVVGIMRDITAQIEARAALLVSEDKYRSLVANAPVIIWTLDQYGGIAFVSPSAQALTGYTPAELPPTFWFTRIHEDDLPGYRAARAGLFQRGTSFDVEYRFRRKDGTWAWLHDRASRVYEDHGKLLADGITVDITGRKLAELEVLRREAQLAEAQSIAHIGSMDIDLVTGNVDWSDEMYRIAGLAPKSRAITFALIRELIPPVVIQNLSEVLIEQEHVMRRIDGTERIVLSRAKLVGDSAAGRRRIVGTVQDITARREAELALQRSERRLELIVSRLPVLLWST
ncbi:MAG TPA: PAS domain S-box protein, partial [Thermoanaerobaculia bacterium]|nr:PAS domain S-box protein [Thermoanaerobaculia bacterium]